MEEQNKFITECVNKDSTTLTKRIISGLFPTAISLVKPTYPKIAKDLNLSGIVTVKIIFDENGNVIYARALNGKTIFHKVVEKAACLSRFTTISYCNTKVKQERFIRYNFIL